MSEKVLNEMIAMPAARKSLADDIIYVLVSSGGGLASGADGLHTVRTAYFTSEVTLASAVDEGTLPEGTEAVLYDNENWQATPAAERADPVKYYQEAFDAAKAHGLLLIATPVPSKLGPEVAPYADVLDIQAQEVQASPTNYANHVLPLAASALKANPKLVILSGLSTNPRAGLPTPAELVADAGSVSQAVKGFWLNVPATPSSCAQSDRATGDARCFGPQPQIGKQFLATLGPAAGH